MTRKTSHLLMAGIVTAVAAASTALITKEAEAAAGVEKCYGVAKAGSNDCATSTSGCAGTASIDSSKQHWIYVPRGTCDKLTGGSKQSG